MAADPKTTLDRAVTEQNRRLLRDASPAPAPVDKRIIRARLEAMLAELQSEECANGIA